MQKLHEWINEYPSTLAKEVNRGVISKAEYIVAYQSYLNIKSSYDNLQLILKSEVFENLELK